MKTRFGFFWCLGFASMALICRSPDSLAQTEDLSVLSRWVEWSDAANMLKQV